MPVFHAFWHIQPHAVVFAGGDILYRLRGGEQFAGLIARMITIIYTT